jgi:hypothetical protein
MDGLETSIFCDSHWSYVYGFNVSLVWMACRVAGISICFLSHVSSYWLCTLCCAAFCTTMKRSVCWVKMNLNTANEIYIHICHKSSFSAIICNKKMLFFSTLIYYGFTQEQTCSDQRTELTLIIMVALLQQTLCLLTYKSLLISWVPNVPAKWLALLLHVWEVLGSNLSLETSYPVWGFSWFCSLQENTGVVP